MSIKNGTLVKSRYSSELNIPGYETRVRYSQAPSELGKRAKLPSDITVFIMAVEIERLVKENTQLKQDLQQLSDSNLDRVQYEIQIRDLMEKLKSQNNSHNSLLVDNEQLQNKLRDLEEQFRRQQVAQREYDPNWRSKLSQMELQITTYQKQINQQTSFLGGQNVEAMARELDELRRRRLQFDELGKQLGGRNINDLLREIDDLRRKQMQSSQSDLLRQQLSQAQARIKQLEGKLQEMDMYVNTIESDLKRFELENQRLTINMTSRTQSESSELLSLRDEVTRLNNELQKLWMDNETLVKEIDSLQLRLRTQNDDELRRVRNELTRLQEQNNQLQLSLSQQEQQFQSQILRLQQSNQTLLLQNQQLQLSIDQSSNNVSEVNRQKYVLDEYKEKIREFELRFQELQMQNERLKQQDHRVAILMAEVDRLNGLVRQLNSDSDEWKQKYQRIELALLDYRQIEKTNRDSVQKNELLLDEIERLKKILEQKQRDMDEINKRYDVLSSQIGTYQVNINSSVSKQQEYESRQRDISYVQSENDRLKRQLQQQQQQLSTLQIQITEQTNKSIQMSQQNRNTNQNGELEKLKRQIYEYENKIAMLSMEITRLKSTNTSNTQSAGLSQVTNLLTVIVMMSAELDSLRGITFEKSIVQSQRIQDNASQSIRSSSVNQANYSYRSWREQ